MKLGAIDGGRGVALTALRHGMPGLGPGKDDGSDVKPTADWLRLPSAVCRLPSAVCRLPFSSGLCRRLPAAAERTVELRTCAELGALRLRQQDLPGEQVLVGGENFQVAGQPGVVTGASQVGGVKSVKNDMRLK